MYNTHLSKLDKPDGLLGYRRCTVRLKCLQIKPTSTAVVYWQQLYRCDLQAWHGTAILPLWVILS